MAQAPALERQSQQNRQPTYRSVVVTRRGSLSGVHIFAQELRDPAPGEVRIRVLASGVHQDDVASRIGNRPTLPKLPYTPGYDLAGVVDEIGDGVTQVARGDRVAALTTIGGHSEYVYLMEDRLVHVPDQLDLAEAVTLILNYLVAYQILHRTAKAKPGDRALIVGASGGVGTAFLQLGGLAGLTLYGTASHHKHDILRELGATPIDYQKQDVVDAIRGLEPDGLDFVFNGMGPEYIARGMAMLRRGGMLVHYGGPQSMRGLVLLLAKMLGYTLLPNGKSIRGYGTHRVPLDILKEDWAVLFKLLEAREIAPLIAHRLRLVDEAIAAYALLESGRAVGNVVLLAPELL